MEIIDISRKLDVTTPTWPGDTPFSYRVNWSKQHTGSVNVGNVTMSVHTATHVDTPFHFTEEGEKLDEIALSTYIGDAFVVDVTGIDSVQLEDVKNKLKNQGGKRILFKTNGWKIATIFPELIPTLDKKVVEFLQELAVPLIGLDLPSVDKIDSKSLPIHHALHIANIHILEGLDLSSVEEGEYQLVALPLKISGSDGSPVRAVLLKP
ncbi:cyclase family protein [Sutcliffiella rhizosphaerae]|uniref:Kynurenine formamidase n=1 Tax=Sutcliffiella rhizosphaerae TaxID=2880967 RepID=A0ABM8YKZ4_9BACI|nr:cyclase family protein [Sutcliffiella rhizosphaerae]CAG9620516.1 Kynurenine formamidase [Sutcliffiella rhizosphaerae]